jgi:hypothetical protein
MGRAARLLFLILACVPSALAPGAEHGAGGGERVVVGTKTFQLSQYVKGTPVEIRRMLQGPVDEFTAKVKEARDREAACEADVEAARQAAVARAHESPKYRQLAAELKEAQAALDSARRSGTVQQRLGAGSRLNRLRAELDKLDKGAAASDAQVPRLEARVREERQSVERCADSLKKATAWRDQWTYAIECTFRMNAPVKPGRVGVLPTVKVLKPHTPAHEGVLVQYAAPERQNLGEKIEGIQTVNVVMKPVRLLLGPDTPGAKDAKAGDELKLYRSYRIEGVTTDADGAVYLAARHEADPDLLMEEIMPLREIAQDQTPLEKKAPLPAEAGRPSSPAR